MKVVKSIAVVLTVSLTMSSCFLFKGGGGSHGGGSCPAYGSLENSNDNLEIKTIEELRSTTENM